MGNANDRDVQRTVAFEIFQGTLITWEELFQQAADFASGLGPDRVISISHSDRPQQRRGDRLVLASNAGPGRSTRSESEPCVSSIAYRMCHAHRRRVGLGIGVHGTLSDFTLRTSHFELQSTIA